MSPGRPLSTESASKHLLHYITGYHRRKMSNITYIARYKLDILLLFFSLKQMINSS